MTSHKITRRIITRLPQIAFGLRKNPDKLRERASERRESERELSELCFELVMVCLYSLHGWLYRFELFYWIVKSEIGYDFILSMANSYSLYLGTNIYIALLSLATSVRKASGEKVNAKSQNTAKCGNNMTGKDYWIRLSGINYCINIRSLYRKGASKSWTCLSKEKLKCSHCNIGKYWRSVMQ